MRKPLTFKTLTTGDETQKSLWALMGVVDTSTSRGGNFFIQSSFGVLDTPLERYNQGVLI
jgi:hypothetical protein